MDEKKNDLPFQIKGVILQLGTFLLEVGSMVRRWTLELHKCPLAENQVALEEKNADKFFEDLHFWGGVERSEVKEILTMLLCSFSVYVFMIFFSSSKIFSLQ